MTSLQIREEDSIIARMIERRITPLLMQRLREAPAVVILGPRQVGKTTLALQVGSKIESTYLDLESEADRARLSEPELYLSEKLDRLVILDEIHRVPRLFLALRGLTPRPERGFYSGCADLNPVRRFLVYPGVETYPLGNDIQAIPLRKLASLLAEEKEAKGLL